MYKIGYFLNLYKMLCNNTYIHKNVHNPPYSVAYQLHIHSGFPRPQNYQGRKQHIIPTG
ncbi:hypothetical protein SP38_10 [Salmonella phage 38]|uniref:Uncharacterized protein n=1 Tax=Salmonella phage 38 TaxID=1654891 RepID=A0A0N7C9D5_9CAUD|nr:hypothetical protein SP38_10 [Salmonella phage 38]AKJ73612.1 hypothetical protein SP38_10 [Salmonella phage 38]